MIPNRLFGHGAQVRTALTAADLFCDSERCLKVVSKIHMVNNGSRLKQSPFGEWWPGVKYLHLADVLERALVVRRTVPQNVPRNFLGYETTGRWQPDRARATVSGARARLLKQFGKELSHSLLPAIEILNLFALQWLARHRVPLTCCCAPKATRLFVSRGWLRWDGALARYAEPRLCVVVELSGAQFYDSQRGLDGERNFPCGAARRTDIAGRTFGAADQAQP